MARRTVTEAGIDYTIADDDPTPRELWNWAVVRTRAVDELTGQAPRVRVRVVTPFADTPAPQARVLRKTVSRFVEGGICGLAARVADVATALTRPGEFVARIEAPGYLPRDLTGAIELARRTMAAAGSGVPSLTVAPGDALPVAPAVRQQFRPGRGALIERPVVTDSEQFSLVSNAVPVAATDVPIDPALVTPRLAGTHVAGVPLHLPDQPMHRASVVRIRGRIQERLIGPPPGLIPAVGAQIGILGYWPTYPSTVSGAPIPVDFCSIDPPLYFDYAPGTVVQRCTFANLGVALALRAHAPQGSRELLVAPFAALNPAGGDILQLEAPVSRESEVVVTAGYTAPPDPLGPARIRLRAPTAFVHRALAVVQRVAVGGLIPAGLCTREGLVGDAVAFAANFAAIPGAGFLAIDHGGARAAYHRYRRVPTATALPAPPPNVYTIVNPATVDADGRIEWPPIARVAQLEIAVMYGGFSIAPIRFALSYESDNPLSILVP